WEGDDRLHSARTAHAALYDRGPTTARSGHERGAPGAGRGGAVLAWSGMRGVVTLAAAQSLPVDFPHRSQLVLIAFVVALVTLVVQGGTLPLLIRVLGIRGTDEEAARRELSLLIAELQEAAIGQVLDNPELRRRDGGRFDAEVLEEVRERFGRPLPGSSGGAAPDPRTAQRRSSATCWPRSSRT